MKSDRNKIEIKNEQTDYEIDMSEFSQLCKIGSGAFATVWQAKWKEQTVVIKGIDYSGEFDFFLCKNEMELMKSFDHPNIVKFYGYNAQSKLSSVFNIVMEYMNKGDLLTYIEHKNNIDWEPKIKIMFGITNAVVYLHHKKILHCDIKPKNVLLNSNGGAKLCDFGLSKKVGVEDKILIRGTRNYLPPEVLKGKENTKKSDIYSLGITLFQVLTWSDRYSIPTTVKNLIPESCPAKTFKKIEECMNDNPDKRPRAKSVLKRL